MLNTLSGGAAADQWVADYHQYLERVVGAAATTCVRHLPIVRRFIARSFGPAAPDWTMLSVGQLGEFIRREAAVRTGHGRKAPACAIRSFLRFLAWRGAVPGGLGVFYDTRDEADMNGDGTARSPFGRRFRDIGRVSCQP